MAQMCAALRGQAIPCSTRFLGRFDELFTGFVFDGSAGARMRLALVDVVRSRGVVAGGDNDAGELLGEGGERAERANG